MRLLRRPVGGGHAIRHDAAADKLRAKGCVELHGELGSVLVARGMEYDDTVELGLRSFFGAKDITVRGIRSWSL